MLLIELPLYPLLSRDLTYFRQCSILDLNLIVYFFSRLIAIVTVTNQVFFYGKY